MNNVTHLNIKKTDLIFEEYNTFVDKQAGVKTIAFKYFSANESQAIEYLGLLPQQNYTFNLGAKVISGQKYFQPELI